MTYTLTPKRGDKVRVRLHTGEAVDAVYGYGQRLFHSVHVNGIQCLATGFKPEVDAEGVDFVRFIYPLDLMPKPEIKS